MDDLKKILESTVLNEDSKTALLEAWDNKLTEAREEIAAELREEYASRYDHDKNLIIEASDKFIKDALKEEFEELVIDKKKIRESRVAIEKQRASLAEKATEFIKNSLQEELDVFRAERKQVNEGILKMQSFVQNQLKEELSDFATDKKELTEARVNFERTKQEQLKEVKARFVESAAKLSEKLIKESLKSELSQLKTDLQESKKKMFGAKLFEAFAAEFLNSHYNEGSQVKKLGKVLEQTKYEISALKESLNIKNQELMEAKKEVRTISDLKERAEIMNGLLAPLNKNQRKVMSKLLESTQTKNLQEGYKKYVSYVLKENSEDLPERGKVLTEGVTSYDGNKETIQFEDDTIIRLKKLSGIK